jgi:hypothetical protein
VIEVEAGQNLKILYDEDLEHELSGADFKTIFTQKYCCFLSL